MLTMVLKYVSGIAFLGSLFWFPSGDCVALLLAIWTIAIAVCACSNLAERFLWIPVVFALVGMSGLVLILAIPGNVILATEEVTLVLFVLSFTFLKKKPSGRLQS